MLFFSALAVGALCFWFGALYVAGTKAVPEYGGEYVEGLVSQPRYINPILSQTSEADASISALVYDGLFSYDANGAIVKRLAEDYTVSEDGKLYTVTLKQGIKWHDGQDLSADDVLFTLRAIQDPAYKSPLRGDLLSVDVAMVDQLTLTFTLKKSYFGFLESLTVGILPKHIWENISPENFLLADYNLAPIGSGPYRFSDSDKDSNGNMLSYELRSFLEHFAGAPYIKTIIFQFYPDERSLLDAYTRKEVLGINSVLPENLPELEVRKSTHVYEMAIPRIFAVFFNVTKSAALAYDEVRIALSLATDRDAIIREVLSGKGQSADTAILPFMNGYAGDLAFARFDEGRANEILDENGWKRGDDGIRAKNGTVLEFELLVPDWPELSKTADILKEQWAKAGARVTVRIENANDLQQNGIRPREYQALLFGEAAMINSDPYSFWHGSQRNDPGLNLALFDNKDADTVLLSLREELNEEKRREYYRTFQEILLREHPAVFLYSPKYLFVVNSAIHVAEVKSANVPAHRFSTIKDWYIKTKRVKK